MAVDAPRRLDHRTARELARMDANVIHLEDSAAWVNARALARRVHLAVVADRPDLALASAGAIVGIADRRLRQLGGDDGRAA